jgi:DNA polymerase V
MDLRKLSADDDNKPVRLFSPLAPCSYKHPVFDSTDTEINFKKYWVPDSRDCYCVIATGNSMINAHIYEGDMLVLNAGIEPQDGMVVAAWLNGDLTIKRLIINRDGSIILQPENDHYPPIPITDNDDFRVLGVVTSSHRRIS